MRRTLLNGFFAISFAIVFLLLGVPQMFAEDEAPPVPAPEDVAARNEVSQRILEHVRDALDNREAVSIFVSRGEAIVTTTPRAARASPSPASPATSTPRCSARPPSLPATPRTPTAQARSC